MDPAISQILTNNELMNCIDLEVCERFLRNEKVSLTPS